MLDIYFLIQPINTSSSKASKCLHQKVQNIKKTRGYEDTRRACPPECPKCRSCVRHSPQPLHLQNVQAENLCGKLAISKRSICLYPLEVSLLVFFVNSKRTTSHKYFLVKTCFSKIFQIQAVNSPSTVLFTTQDAELLNSLHFALQRLLCQHPIVQRYSRYDVPRTDRARSADRGLQGGTLCLFYNSQKWVRNFSAIGLCAYR